MSHVIKSPGRPVENLSKRQRELTPLPLAAFLIARLYQHFRPTALACLWVRSDTIYREFPCCDIWDKDRDANKYAGPHPVICHPPCGPWGRYRNVSTETIDHGIAAMNIVHQFGGVVEHPIGSPLFEVHGKGGYVQRINQYDFGHPSPKATLLYWYLP